VVVISADATTGLVNRLRAEGAADYLAKPFDIGQLLALVDEHTTGRHPA
jgi:DNA-binding response OmpR family regulator